MGECQQKSFQRRAEISKLLPIRTLNAKFLEEFDPHAIGDNLELAEEISNKILHLKTEDKIVKFIVIKGSYGFGKSSLLDRISHEIPKQGDLTCDKVWVLKFDRSSSVETIFSFLSEKADLHGLRKEQQILKSTQTSYRQRLDAAIKVLFYCSLLIIDDIDANDLFDFEFLHDIASKDLVICLSCTNSVESQCSSCSVYEIPCRWENALHKHLLLQYDESERKKLTNVAKKLGPLYGKILLQAVSKKILNLEEANELLAMHPDQTPHNQIICDFFLRLFRHLTKFDQQLLLSISTMRVSLPIANEGMFQNLINLGILLKRETESKKMVIQPQSSINQIIRQCKLESKSGGTGDAKQPTMLCLWMLLLPDILKELIEKAEDHSWPFVPEAWQYKDMITEKERYNLKDIIHQKNKFADFEEIEILQECLYSALVDANYSVAAAILFVMDRFIYWQGSTKYQINLTNYIQRNSRDTAIPPQIVIRKARILKNEGNIQEAEKVLSSLMLSGQGIGRWVYKSEADYQLVSSVCVQIRGDISRGLGLCVDAAKDLIKSIIGFKTLPKIDIKGWSSSLSLLADAYQYMPLEDYTKQMRVIFNLSSPHPILEAIKCVNEAAELSIYSPLFYMKNKRRAGELMYMFARTIPSKSREQLFYLQCAATELMSGLQCHTSIASLESREQFYEFVFCTYKLAKVIGELKKFQSGMDPDPTLQNAGVGLMSLSKKLYEHYCSFPARLQHDKQSIMLIQAIMLMLNLPEVPLQEKEISIPEVVVEKGPKQEVVDRETQGTKEQSCNREISVDDGNPDQKKPEGLTSQQPLEGGAGADGRSEDRAASVAFQDQSTFTTEDTTADRNEREAFRLCDTERTGDDLQLAGQDFQVRNASTVSETEEGLAEKNDLANFRDASTASSILSVDSDSVLEQLHNEKDSRPNGDAVERAEDDASKDSGIADIRKEATYLTEEDFTTSEDFKMRMKTTLATIDERMGTSEWSARAVANALKAIRKLTPKVHDAIVWRYDPLTRKWFSMETLACIGDKLELKKDKEGACRDAYMVEYMNQEEPLGRYVAKQYKIEKYKENPKFMQQYKQDVICQVTSRFYATQFNQKMFQKGLSFSQVQFLPAVVIELLDLRSVPERLYNVEPYMAGDFTKITNNFKWVKKEDTTSKKLLLAFSHFSYCKSNGEMLIVDIQGWTSDDNVGVTFLTDPQIHTPNKKGFGSANRGQAGFNEFWSSQHPKCNDVCKALSLERP